MVTKVDVPKEERFVGVITRIHDGIQYDADSFMIIGGKKVIFNQASSGIDSVPPTYIDRTSIVDGRKVVNQNEVVVESREKPNFKRGELIGFDDRKFPCSGGDVELKTKYAGKKAEVFALKTSYVALDGNKPITITEYTLFGSDKYYIKIVK